MFIILLQICPSLAHGSDVSLVPSISIRQQYNSNILLSTDPLILADRRNKDFITTFSPGLEFVDRTERFDTDLQVRLDRLEYIRNRDLSSTNQFYDGKFRYRVTQLFNISAEAAYIKNTNPTLDLPFSTLQPGLYGSPPATPPPASGPGQPGPGQGGIPASAAEIPLVAVPWHRITAALSADYQLDEKASAAVTYTYGRDYYNNNRYQDNTSHDVNAGLVYDLDQYLTSVKGRVNIGYSYYHLPDSKNNNVRATVGLSRDLDEKWSVLADIGVRRTWSELSVLQKTTLIIPFPPFPTYILVTREDLSNAGWGGVGKASLNYRGECGSGSISYSRDITLASGLNGAAESDTLTLSAQYRHTYELSSFLTTGYQAYRSDSSNLSSHVIKEQVFVLNAGVRYEFPRYITSGRMFAEASYGYNFIDDSASSQRADRQLFSIRLYIDHPLFE